MRHAIKVEEAAEILGISRSYAYAQARTGDLPTVKIGRRIVVPIARLAELLGVPASELTATLAEEPAHGTA